MRVLADVAQSAVAERAVQLVHPSRTVLIRATGISSVVGGAVFLAGMITPLRGPARAGVPVSVVGMAAGAVGLYLALHGRSPRLERLGLVRGAAGLALGFIGMAGSALGVVQPNPLAPIINTGEHAGLVFIGAGMSVWGILALRTHALGWLSVAPLPLACLDWLASPSSLRIPSRGLNQAWSHASRRSGVFGALVDVHMLSLVHYLGNEPADSARQ